MSNINSYVIKTIYNHFRLICLWHWFSCLRVICRFVEWTKCARRLIYTEPHGLRGNVGARRLNITTSSRVPLKRATNGIAYSALAIDMPSYTIWNSARAPEIFMILKVSISRMFSWNWECCTMPKIVWWKKPKIIWMKMNRMKSTIRKRIFHRFYQKTDIVLRTMKPLKWWKWPKFGITIICTGIHRVANAQTQSHPMMAIQLPTKRDCTKCANPFKSCRYAGNIDWWKAMWNNFFNLLNFAINFSRRYFRDYTWTLVSYSDMNITQQIVHCRCPKNSISYLIKREPLKTGALGYTYLFACSPQSVSQIAIHSSKSYWNELKSL